MEFNETPLYSDVEAVLNDPDPVYDYTFAATLSVAGVALETLKVISIDEVENYHEDCFSVVTCEVLMGLGTYVKDVFPSREDVEIIIYKQDYFQRNPLRSYVYKAILLDADNPAVENEKYVNVDRETLNVSDVVEINFQLISKTSEELRLSTTGGIYRQETVKSVLEYSLTEAMAKVETEDDLRPLGVDIIDGVNETEYEQIVIDHTTPLIDVPGYLQNKSYGVYPTGLGHFFKNGYWYIFPLYDTERFDTFRENIDITLVPGTTYEVLDRTSKQIGSTMLVICAGERYINNAPEVAEEQSGLGTRFTDPLSMLTSFVDTHSSDNKAIANRGLATTEASDQAATGEFTNAPSATQLITANHMKQMSEIASRKGQYFTAVWRYSNPEMFFPGMTIRVKMMEDAQVVTYTGTIVGVIHQTKMLGKGLTTDRWFCTSTITAYINRLA